MKKRNMFTNSILLSVLAVAFLLSATIETQAKTSNHPDANLDRGEKIAVSNGDLALRSVDAATLKTRLLRLIERKATRNPKFAKSLSKSCGCAVAAPDDADGFRSCMAGCLKDVGVSPYAIIICGATCVTGSPLCAICLGVGLTVVEVCALGCAAYPGPYTAQDLARIKRRHATVGALQARLRTQPARGRS